MLNRKKKINSITPDEVGNLIEFPNYVIKAINQLIVDKFANGYKYDFISFSKDEAEIYIMSYGPLTLSSTDIVLGHLLDFAYLYEKFGWDVTIDGELWTFRRKNNEEKSYMKNNK